MWITILIINMALPYQSDGISSCRLFKSLNLVTLVSCQPSCVDLKQVYHFLFILNIHILRVIICLVSSFVAAEMLDAHSPTDKCCGPTYNIKFWSLSNNSSFWSKWLVSRSFRFQSYLAL